MRIRAEKSARIFVIRLRLSVSSSECCSGGEILNTRGKRRKFLKTQELSFFLVAIGLEPVVSVAFCYDRALDPGTSIAEFAFKTARGVYYIVEVFT